MQTYNSFNELAANTGDYPHLSSPMSVFNWMVTENDYVIDQRINQIAERAKIDPKGTRPHIESWINVCVEQVRKHLPTQIKRYKETQSRLEAILTEVDTALRKETTILDRRKQGAVQQTVGDLSAINFGTVKEQGYKKQDYAEMDTDKVADAEETQIFQSQ